MVINADKIKLTGKKESFKTYYRHSGYIGNLKKKTAKEIREENPTKLLFNAVRGMIPRNKLRERTMDKLKLYAGAEHPHEAQKPEALTFA